VGDIAQFLKDSVGYTGVEVIDFTEPRWDGEVYLVDAEVRYDPHHWRVTDRHTIHWFNSYNQATERADLTNGVIEPVSCEDVEAGWPTEMRKVHVHT
jgi:hypothetical protein